MDDNKDTDTLIKKKVKIYLSGPIQNCSDEEIYGWRNKVIKLSEKWAECIVPPVFALSQVNRNNSRPIVEGDKRNIDSSDVLLVNIIPGKPATGTHQEEIYAWMHGKYVVVVVPSEMDVTRISPWLLYHSHRVFISLTSAVDHIYRKYQ